MSGHGGFPIGRRRARRDAGPPGSTLWADTLAGGWDLGIEVFGRVTGRGREDGAGTAPPEQAMKGYRHFLSGDLPTRRRSLINGPASNKDGDPARRLRQLMSRLARRMDVEFEWPEHPAGAKERYPALRDWENPEIPSGYTYLLQLVAHDLVATSFPISILEETTTGARNTRSAALRLDTIYGGGPAVCPFAYAPHDAEDTGRSALRLGRMKGLAKMRDIPRMPAPGADEKQRDILTDVAIPDPRNDDNPIVAQMAVLFHLLHQIILDMLKGKQFADSREEAGMDRFLCARGAVTLIYRNIIRNDLLQRILHPAVHKFYSERPSGFEFLDKTAPSPDGDARIPLEFSHAAFRFGHAMVRPKYRFNERPDAEFSLGRVLMQTCAKLATEMPLDAKWIVRWSHFFPIKGSKPNLSRRIGPYFSPEFLDPEHFSDIDEVEKKAGLAYRDLLVGGFLNLWPVSGLIDIIRNRRPELFRQSKLLANSDYRVLLKRYLEANKGPSGFKDEDGDIDTLAQDPPLAFFVLWEAAVDPDTRGLKLGLLGSIIVAEVIFAAMTRDPVTGESGARSLKDALAKLSEQTYDFNYLGDVDEINSMDQLIEFVAKKKGWENEEPGFV